MLGYADYRNFVGIVEKAKTACRSMRLDPDDHIGDVNEMVEIGSGAKKFTVIWRFEGSKWQFWARLRIAPKIVTTLCHSVPNVAAMFHFMIDHYCSPK